MCAVAALVVVATAGCNGGGSVTLPTSVSRTVTTSASGPALTLPTVSRSGAAPSGTPAETTSTAAETPAPSPSPSGSASEPATVTRPGVTQTATVTQTSTATVTQTSTATVTRTDTATVTRAPATSATPTASASTSTPAGEVAAAPVADEGTVWWPWLLLGLVALGLLAWLLLRRRRADEVLAAWDARLDAARQEASWVEDALTAQVLATPTTQEAQSVWGAARPRLLAIDENLHALVTDAPDEQRGAAATNLREQLGRLVEAVGADLAAGSSTDPDDFRTRRAAIDAARKELRQTLGPVGPPPPPPAAPGASAGTG